MTIKTLATGLPSSWPMSVEIERFLLALALLVALLLLLLLPLSQTICCLLGVK